MGCNMQLNARLDHLVIGVCGPVGSGVTTISKALEQNGFCRASLSEPIKDDLRKKEGLLPDSPINEKTVKHWRKKLQDIGNAGRQIRLSYWAERALQNVRQDAEQIVLDGIRNIGEIQYLRRTFTRCFIVAAEAPFSVRWERVKDEYGGIQQRFIEDDYRDCGEGLRYGQQVSKAVQDADYVVVNNEELGTKETRLSLLYSKKLHGAVQLMRHYDSDPLPPDVRSTPTDPEIHMATAYAQSRASHCKKRYVGAVIVSPENLTLSIGYNENPMGMHACVTRYGDCFKDLCMEKKLERMEGVYCPRCGKLMASLASPWRCDNNDCRANLKALFFPSRNIELCTAIHAEERAIRSLEGRTVKGATMFVTTFPCLQCSRHIIDVGIERVVYVEPYPIKEAEALLRETGVKTYPFEGFKARAFNLVYRQLD